MGYYLANTQSKMKPKSNKNIPQDDLFRMRLDNMLDLEHELIKLSKLIDWDSLELEWGELFFIK